MKIILHREEKGLIQSYMFIQEEKDITSEDELKATLKKIYQAMKKNNGFSGVSFQLCSDNKEWYVVVERYEAESESYKTVWHDNWRCYDTPVMRSQRNLTAWAAELYKADSQESREAC